MVSAKLTVLAPNAKELVRNLLLLKDGTVLAGYRIGPERWDFTGYDPKLNTMDKNADVWGQLVGRYVTERVTSKPHPVQEWARKFDLRTPHPLPDVEGIDETWNKHLARQQHRIAQTGMDDKLVFRYFSVGTVKSHTELRKYVIAYIETGLIHESIKEVLAEEKRVRDIVMGWGARRMSEREQAWLRMRSLAPGIQPLPLEVADRNGWDEFAMPMLANNVRWNETPFGRTVSVHAWQDGKRLDRAVQVLTVARLEDMRYPDNGLEPWQAYAERAVDADGRPFSVEWCINGELVPGEDISAEAELDLRKVSYLKKDYQDHDEIPPETVDRGLAVARSTRDQVTTGQATQAGRFKGTINVVISGEAVYDRTGRLLKTAEEVCEERAAAFIRLYAGNNMRMEFTAPLNQSERLAEFVPGEPRDEIGYQRQIRFSYLAAGLPSVSNSVGDGAGSYIGHTRGAARRPVFHDSHFATEGRGNLGRGQNVFICAGTLGAGKSVLLGLIAYENARRGTTTIVSDPSGPLLKLCEMPELAPFSQGIDLLKGRPGILSPPSLIREPLPDEFDEPGEYADAKSRAMAERRDLVVDTARRSIGADLYEDDRTQGILREAARKIEWSMVHSLWHLIDELRKSDDPFVTQIANALEDASTAPVLSLLFPKRGELVQREQYNAVLTVISTPGIRRAPDGIPRQDWNPQEHAADVILRLVALFTDRLIYSKPRSQRGVVILDETEDLTDFGPGRGFISRLGRDHSKWNLGVYFGFKSINQEMLSGELRNFIGGAFVGRMANIEAAVAMLEVLNVADRTYARTLMRLSEVAPGEFIHLDVLGRVGGIRVDVDYHPELKAALLTNPTPEGSEAWTTEDVL